jgi:hypothetical protein
MVRGGWFLSLAVIAAVLMIARLALRRPLLPRHARALPAIEAVLIAASLVLLIFHCAAMFAPDAVAAFRVLDRPAAVVRDLRDPIGQAAFWIPAAALVVGTRGLWWPAPISAALSLVAVGWTMYGDFTLTQHLIAILVAGVLIAGALSGLVTRLVRGRDARTASRPVD